MKDRIRQIMESQNLSQQSFADMLNISPASLSSIFNDRTRPTLNHVDAIKRSFPNINLEWLLYGKGEMFESPENDGRISGGEHQVSGAKTMPSDDSPMLDFGSAATLPPSPKSGQATGINTSDFANYNDFQGRKIIDIKQRKITEIRIFYDDQTWETFVAKK